MPTAWLSTLKNLERTLKVNRAAVERRFPAVLTTPDYDLPITLSTADQNWIDEQCDALRYPACGSCNESVLGCRCTRQAEYKTLQEEHQSLLTTINAAEQSIQNLLATPFRQSRNAFGFAASIFGFVNLVLANVAMEVAALWVTLLLPPLLLGGYVYARGRREEGKINSDLQADWLDKKINLLCKERDAIELRFEKNQDLLIPYDKKAKPKLPKEKRDIPGNSLSHFIGSAFSTAGITYTVIKYGAFSTLVPVGSVIGWSATGGLGGTVGLYFAYKRFSHLTNKVKTESLMAILATQESDINAFINQLSHQSNHTNDAVYASHASIHNRLSQHPVAASVHTPLLSDDERIEIIVAEQKTPAVTTAATSLYQPPSPR